MNNSTFIPALKHHALTPLYDVLARMTIPEMRFKRHLIRAANIAAGDRVLDIGCGTGTLLRIAFDQQPGAIFSGIDPDRRILDRARSKFASASSVTFQEGSATDLPFADASFDRVLSTLMIHHLSADEKARAMREALRVLRVGGEFHLGDFAHPDTTMTRVMSFLTERIGREHVQENFRGMLPAMLREAGFSAVEETSRYGTIFGVLRAYRATRS
jgi:ubiquinone/menaquinone biosynthesis C-methylase UbiE